MIATMTAEVEDALSTSATSAKTLLLVTHVPIRQGRHGAQIDDQTAAGIAQWCRHFDHVTYYGITDERTKSGSTTWVDIAEAADPHRCELVGLPCAYGVGPMATHYWSVRARLRGAIARHRYLCFTIGSLVGDWPAVAALEAMQQKRRYAAWIDRVEVDVIRNKLASAPLQRRLIGSIALPLLDRGARYLIERSAVALLQGRDTFDYYTGIATEAHCTYDTHTHASDQIAPESLARKQARILDGAPLHILYVGRAAAMKGPGDWLETLARLQHEQVPFRATWIGDGPELRTMKERVASSALSGSVHLPGFEGNRLALLNAMRESDLLLFCHKTAESPRVLIEALVSGCPLVGYETAYPRGLVEAQGGGSFVARDNVEALARRVADLHGDRAALAGLVRAAAASGEAYTEDAVYAHRAQLMQRA